MKKQILIALLTATGLATLLGWQRMTQSRHHQDHGMAFNVDQLFQLQPFGNFNPDKDFRGDTLVLLYFDALTCQTCQARELTRMKHWQANYGERVDFFLVVHGQNDTYLHNLRRVGRVDYPILLEKNRGELGFSHGVVAIVDVTTSRALAWVPVQPDTEANHHLNQLEDVLRDHLAHTSSRHET